MKKMENNKEIALKILKNIFKGKNGKIIKMKPIHLGYTNFSYFVQYENGKKYQVRLPHCGKLVNRANEQDMLSLVGDHNFIYFDKKTGNAVKEWLNAKNPHIPHIFKWKYIDQLFLAIKKIHSIKLPKKHKFAKINYDLYNNNLYHLKIAYQAKYLSIIQTYRDDPMVLNHTDINRLNILLDNNKKIHLIDYEWCGLASDYWDYANFIRESKIYWYQKIDWTKYIENFSMQKLKDYIFVCAVYAYLWTWIMPQTKRIKKYRLKTMRQLRYYAKGAIHDKE